MSNRELLAIHSGDCGENWRNNIERSQRDGKEEKPTRPEAMADGLRKPLCFIRVSKMMEERLGDDAQLIKHLLCKTENKSLNERLSCKTMRSDA